MDQLSVSLGSRYTVGSCSFCNHPITDIVLIAEDKYGRTYVRICPECLRELWEKGRSALKSNGLWR